jgi:hypothetical protein
MNTPLLTEGFVFKITIKMFYLLKAIKLDVSVVILLVLLYLLTSLYNRVHLRKKYNLRIQSHKLF